MHTLANHLRSSKRYLSVLRFCRWSKLVRHQKSAFFGSKIRMERPHSIFSNPWHLSIFLWTSLAYRCKMFGQLTMRSVLIQCDLSRYIEMFYDMYRSISAKTLVYDIPMSGIPSRIRGDRYSLPIRISYFIKTNRRSG